MNHQLVDSLQKTGFWMRMIGLILSAFNTLCWLTLVYHVIRYNLFRWPLPSFLMVAMLTVSSFAGLKAIQASFSIRNYIQTQAPHQLQKAFLHEGNFWNALTVLCIAGATTILLAYFRLL